MSKDRSEDHRVGTPSSRHTVALGRIAGLGCAAVLLLTAAACGNGDSSAPAAAGRGTAQPDVQFDLAAAATWRDLLNAIGRSDELSCIDEAISDQDLPGDFLDLPLFDEDGYPIWPVWSSVYFGVVEEGESHWPASIWKCLDSDTLAAAYISSQYGALRRQGLVPGEIPEDCVQEFVNDPGFTGATTATLTSEREFDEGEQLDEFFAALDERFFFGLLECPLPTEADADQPAPSETAQADDDAGETAGGERLSAEAVYSRIAPSIPLVETQSAIGSGILIDGGYVVTNYHVVWPHDSAWIVFPDGTEFADVPVIGWDPFADLAVLGVVSHSAPPLRLADGEDLSIGSDVFLVGYPAEMDLFPEPSITGGILSRVREWDRYAVTMFQTDAQIAGGQSGGALVDSRGRVIGISTWSFEDGGFSVATSAADDVEIVESLIADNEEFAFSDRRAPIGTGEFEVQVDLANGWDSRTFLFEALAGTTVSVELDGPSDGAITVSGPDGILLEVDDGYSGVESGTVELLSGGIHYVTVSTASGDLRDPASYGLTSSVRLNPFHDPDDGAHLPVDYQIGAVIDYYGDIDWYLTTLTEGETVVFRTDAIATDTFLAVAPVADAEALVFDDDSGSTLFGDSFNAEIVYTAPVSGDYYIVVGDAVGAGGGSYFLAIDIDPALGPGDSVEIPDTGAGTGAYDYYSFPAWVGEAHGGSIDRPDDIHAFWFEAAEGETYQIDVEPQTLDDPVAALYDEDGVELAYNDDHGDSLASRIVWTAPLSGDYYIEVHGWGGTGSYTLTITTTDLDELAPVLPGDGVDVIAGRADWYSGYFQAELYKQLLGELGFNVSDPAEQELPPSLAYLAMAEGDMDYWPNSWYPAHRPFLEEELADGTLVADHVSIVGDEMIAGGLQGFLITKSFADEYGVYTMDALNSNAAALRAFDATDPVPGNGMADIFSCPESWCGSVVTDHIAFSGWDNIQPTTADYDAMFALAVDSVNERVPMVFYTWTPSAFITRLQPGGNVYWMGFNDRQFGADGSSGFATINPQQCPSAAHTDNGMCPIGWTANDILVTARNEFLDANPTAETLFELVKLPIIDVSLAIAAQEEEGAHPADLAAEWIADNRRLVDSWIAAAVAAA